MDTNSLLDLAEKTARAAGEMLVSTVPSVLRTDPRDLKLDADMRAHSLIEGSLVSSGIPVLSEEGKTQTRSPLEWVIDPLDGSVNFFRGIPNCAVSIALLKDGEPLLGVIYDFNRNEMFSGVVGRGATLNSASIRVSDTTDARDAIICTGFPASRDFSRESLADSIALFQSFKKVRLLGSAALSLAWVACGRADAYWEKGIYVWDVAAGLALVRAAGGFYNMKFNSSELVGEVAAAAHEQLTIFES